MKSFSSILFFLILSNFAISQEFNTRYDHQALLVRDLSKSADFYKTVLRLQEIPAPVGNSSIRWFSFGNDQQLHLIEGREGETNSFKAVHFAINVDNLEAFISNLRRAGVAYSDWPGSPNTISERGDGVRQIYIQDPDDYWIEINDASY